MSIPQETRSEEDDFLAEYNPRDHPPFAVTVDVVVFTIVDDTLQVVLIRRGEPPFKDRWALPGGYVRPGEDLLDAALRELAEETKLGLKPDRIEQLRTYGAPDRDPRMRTVTTAFWSVVAEVGDLSGGGDAIEAALVPVNEIEREDRQLAFDHRMIVLDAVDRAASRLEYSTEATRFCPPEFTISQLRRVYKAVWDIDFDQGNFQRKVRSEPDFVRDLGRTTLSGGSRGRPAALFSAGEPSLLEQPFTALRTSMETVLHNAPLNVQRGPDYPAWLAGSKKAAPTPDDDGDADVQPDEQPDEGQEDR